MIPKNQVLFIETDSGLEVLGVVSHLFLDKMQMNLQNGFSETVLRAGVNEFQAKGEAERRAWNAYQNNN